MTQHSTAPVWTNSLQQHRGRPVDGDLTCDVCVVGAGIAGLTTAYLLAQAGREVMIVDANDSPGGGETRFTTAHLATALDDRYYDLERVRGAEAAKLAHQSHAAAISKIESIIAAEKIDCGFRRLEGHLFAARGEGKTIEKEFKAAQAAGCDVAMMPKPPIASLGNEGCLRFANQATFEPGKYMAGLWRAAEKLGVQFHGRTRVQEVEGGPSPSLKTERGLRLTAKAIVVVTNTPIHTRFALHTKLAGYTTYAIAGPVPRGSVPDALYWDTLDPYHYIRLVTSRDQNTGESDLLVIGGNDHRTGQDDHSDRRWADLESWTRERFPQFGTMKHRWSGMVMETLDGLAYIGRDPGGDANVYVAAGDSGMGMTHGTIAGLLISDLVAGRPNPWEDLYLPSRTPVRTIGDYVSENVRTARPYVDWFTGGDVASIADIPAGQGAVVRSGLTKLAVYKAAEGAVHACSAICPHLGALVRWNPGESTWDCPAHGSRFDATGKVFHGPAHCGLSKTEPPEV